MKKWDVEKINSFQKDLLSWYDAEKRDLPWRINNDPYRVWISEIMLQQTQVVTVIDYFNRFMDLYPNIQTLANAMDDQLLKVWEGLGYYSRARNLKEAAIEIETNYNGIFPSNVEDISSLKGIGPYTTGAIASISFNQPEPAIDGNLMRVFSRVFEIKDDISKAKSRKTFDQVIRNVISHNEPGDFNQACMDLGASLCSPTSPQCNECPINQYCASYKNNTMLNYPVKSKKIKQKQLYYYAYVYVNEDNDTYLTQREDNGLLASMWTFPMVEISKKQYEQSSDINEHQPKYVLDKASYFYLGEVSHIFSHLKWHVKVYVRTIKSNMIDGHGKWISKDDYKDNVFPKVQLKMFDLLNKAK